MNYLHKNGKTNKVAFGVALVLFLLHLLATLPIKANDVQIAPTGPTFGLTNLQWGITGANGFNNNFFFSPLFLNESVCVYVYNNNSTNNHAFSVGISVNGNPQNTTPSDGSWLYLGQTNSIATGVATGVPGGMGVTVSGAPLVAVNLTNSVVLSGSPDTANVYIVQTTGTCFSGVQNPNIVNGNGPGTNVQGMVPSGFNGSNINPLLIGATKSAINGGFNVQGIDNFTTSQTSFGSGITGNVTLGFPPQPSANGEFVFAFYSPILSVGAASLVGPWACVEASSCATSSVSSIEAAFLNNYNTGQALQINLVNGGNFTASTAFVSYFKAPTIAQHSNQNSNSFAWNNLPGGNYVLVAFSCTTACIAGSVTDTQGNNYKLVSFVPLTGGSNSNTIYVFATTQATAGGVFTTTINMLSGAVANAEYLQLSNTTAAPLNLQSTPLFTQNNKFTSYENDNGGLFTEQGGYSATQTNTIAAAGTTTFSLWAANTVQNTTLILNSSGGPGPHGIFYSCMLTIHVSAASGTTPTLDTFFQDSGDNNTFNDRMHMPQATAAGTFIGAISGGVGGITPVASTDGVLAAATKIDGPVGPYGRIKFVVGGTTPSFTFTWNVVCR